MKAIGQLFLLYLIVLSVSYASSSDPTQGVKTIFTNLRDMFCNVLSAAIMIAIALSATLYTAGQMFGAEQRAKMVSWAAGAATFAIVAIIVYLVVPWIAGQLGFTQTLSCP